MCGIVGLFLKDEALEPQLGALLAGMLEVMTDRGPDSAGFAVYGAVTRAVASSPCAARISMASPARSVWTGRCATATSSSPSPSQTRRGCARGSRANAPISS